MMVTYLINVADDVGDTDSLIQQKLPQLTRQHWLVIEIAQLGDWQWLIETATRMNEAWLTAEMMLSCSDWRCDLKKWSWAKEYEEEKNEDDEDIDGEIIQHRRIDALILQCILI